MLKTILVPLDDSEHARRVLPYVTALAAGSRTHVLLVYAIGDAALRAHGNALLEEVGDQLAKQGAEVSGLVPEGKPSTSIVAAAHAHQADLIAMATEHLSDLDRWLNGSVTDEVLRHAGIPLLVVPPGCQDWPSGGLKVLVPLDGSEVAEAALAPALAIAKRTDGELLVLRVIHEDEAPDEAAEYVAVVAARLEAQGTRPNVLVVSGSVAHAIVDVARLERVDVIAMATHGRTGLARLTLGSIATRTLQRAAMPVVLIRPAQAALAREGLSEVEPVPALSATPMWSGA